MKSVLFETHHLYYLPHFEPIIREFQKRRDYELSASIPRTVSAQEQEHFANAISKLDVQPITADTEDSRIARLHGHDFDVVLVGNIGRLRDIVTEGSLAVMVYHGIGLKQSYYRDSSPRIDLRAIESESRLNCTETEGATNLVLTGLTKLDPLIEDTTNLRETFLQDRSLYSDRSTVLYAPSFYPSSLGRFLPELPGLAELVNLIIKLHSFSWYQDRYRHQSLMAEQTARQNESIYLAAPHEYNILPYYGVADVLISDISSTLFEFLVLDRPIIQTEFFSLKLRHRVFRRRLRRRIDQKRSDEVDFTYRLARPEDSKYVLNNALQHPQEMSPARVQAAQRFLYEVDGKASERLVDAIESRLE